jgi:hypothetical protein
VKHSTIRPNYQDICPAQESNYDQRRLLSCRFILYHIRNISIIWQNCLNLFTQIVTQGALIMPLEILNDNASFVNDIYLLWSICYIAAIITEMLFRFDDTSMNIICIKDGYTIPLFLLIARTALFRLWTMISC